VKAGELRSHAYDRYAEIANEELGDEFADLPVTWELAERIRLDLTEDLGDEAGDVGPSMYFRWLSVPEVFSPHVDRVAIGRALDFDWPVIEQLTNKERKLFVAALAEMDDPWGRGDGDLLTEILREASPNGNIGRVVSDRSLAWARGTATQRDTIVSAVRRARERGRR